MRRRPRHPRTFLFIAEVEKFVLRMNGYQTCEWWAAFRIVSPVHAEEASGKISSRSASLSTLAERRIALSQLRQLELLNGIHTIQLRPRNCEIFVLLSWVTRLVALLESVNMLVNCIHCF